MITYGNSTEPLYQLLTKILISPTRLPVHRVVRPGRPDPRGRRRERDAEHGVQRDAAALRALPDVPEGPAEGPRRVPDRRRTGHPHRPEGRGRPQQPPTDVQEQGADHGAGASLRLVLGEDQVQRLQNEVNFQMVFAA